MPQPAQDDGIENLSNAVTEEVTKIRNPRFKRFVFGSSYSVEARLRDDLKNITKRLAGEPEDSNRLLAALLLVLSLPQQAEDYTTIIDNQVYDFSDADSKSALDALQTLLFQDPSDYFSASQWGQPGFDIKEPNEFLQQHLRHIVCHTVLDTTAKIVNSEQFQQKHPEQVASLNQGICAARTTVNRLSMINHTSFAAQSIIKNLVSRTKMSGSLVNLGVITVSFALAMSGVVMLATPLAPVGAVLFAAGTISALGMMTLSILQDNGKIKGLFNNYLNPALNALSLANFSYKLGLAQSEATKVDGTSARETTSHMLKHGLFRVATAAVSAEHQEYSANTARTIEPGVGFFKRGIERLGSGLTTLDEGLCSLPPGGYGHMAFGL